MTIASEISRLQTDKECMRQAIIDKGVDVAASVSFDDYAACIAEISSGPKTGYVDILVVGGGGGGGSVCCYSSGRTCFGGGGGGGAGGYVYNQCFPINQSDGCYSVKVGTGGNGGRSPSKGCPSCFGTIVACGGGNGGVFSEGADGASGGGGGGANYCQVAPLVMGGGSGIPGQGNNGGSSWYCLCSQKYHAGGGGGAATAGCNGDTFECGNGGNGGDGCANDISGTTQYYAGGGGGATYDNGSASCGGLGGGGNGSVTYYCNGYQTTPATPAANYGGGGGGGIYRPINSTGCSGCQGVVILRYHTDGSDGLLPTSFGGCRYNCGVYTIHCFTNTSMKETFIPVFK